VSTVLVVDDTPQNVRLLEAVLTPHGYRVLAAGSGADALEVISAAPPDLVLLDVVMPGMDGYEVCRRLREDAATRLLPVVMITASGEQQKVEAIEAGADDFVPKPFNQAELLARVRSLVRIKRYQDELAELNRTLEERVRQQVDQLERLGRLRRFLSRQVAELVVSSGDDALLRSHRRQITVLAGDLRGFTAFSETAEPEEAMEILGAYHAGLGELIRRHDGTIQNRCGDGVMVVFNDPLPCPEHPAEALRLALAMRARMAELTAAWRRRGHELGFGVGVATGYATLGLVGHEDRYDYTATGPVVNLADRFCDEAAPGQIVVSQRVQGATEALFTFEPLGAFQLRGFPRPVGAYNVLGPRSPA